MQKQHARKKVVVGSEVSDRVNYVVTRQCVNILLSQLHPDSTADNVESYTAEALHNVPDCDLTKKYKMYSFSW